MKTFPKPTCKQCGECCKYQWQKVSHEDKERYLYFLKTKNPGTKIIRAICDNEECEVYCVPQPCVHLESNRCNLHGKPEQPDVCIKHGFGHWMFYPEGCVYYDYYKDMPIGVKE